jgi:hypothetical protein
MPAYRSVLYEYTNKACFSYYAIDLRCERLTATATSDSIFSRGKTGVGHVLRGSEGSEWQIVRNHDA